MNLKEYQGISVELSQEDEVFSGHISSFLCSLFQEGLEMLEMMLPSYKQK
jgi:hypothetical protein